MQDGDRMKIIDKPHKIWSVWGLGALAVLEAVRAYWPALEGHMPSHVHAWGLLYLIIIVTILRIIKQRMDSRHE